jgi:hypothetical protein
VKDHTYARTPDVTKHSLKQAISPNMPLLILRRNLDFSLIFLLLNFVFAITIEPVLHCLLSWERVHFFLSIDVFFTSCEIIYFDFICCYFAQEKKQKGND